MVDLNRLHNRIAFGQPADPAQELPSGYRKKMPAARKVMSVTMSGIDRWVNRCSRGGPMMIVDGLSERIMRRSARRQRLQSPDQVTLVLPEAPKSGH